MTAAPTPANCTLNPLFLRMVISRSSSAARRFAAYELADFPDAVPGHGAAGESFGEPDRLVVFDLGTRADHDSRGAPEAFVVEIAPPQHLRYG
jgi:hypothetical protein